MKRIGWLWVWAMLVLVLVVSPAAWAVRVALDDSRLEYVGRFDWRDPAGLRFEWSASSVTLRFREQGVVVRLRDSGEDVYEVVLDGRAERYSASAGEQSIDVHVPRPGAAEHELTIFKCTEAFVGRGQILGIDLPDGGELLPPRPMTRRLEVIGDSISCGYGDEAANQQVHFSPATENAYLAYGAIAARTLGAQYVCIAWSGRKMWPNDTIPAVYDLTLPTDPASRWEFRSPPPDAVLINLGTNDFAHENPDQRQWTAAYEAFVHHVRSYYPNAMVYLAAGTMMSDAWPVGHQAMTTLRRYLRQIEADLRAGGDRRVRLIDFGTQDGLADGLGADYHPSLQTHRKMAAKLVAALEADLGWTAATTEP